MGFGGGAIFPAANTMTVSNSPAPASCMVVFCEIDYMLFRPGVVTSLRDPERGVLGNVCDRVSQGSAAQNAREILVSPMETSCLGVMICC